MYSLIFSTTQSKEDAEAILRPLLEKKLVACGNIIENVTSHYWWQGRIEASRECLLILKTETGRIGKVMTEIRQTHTYKIPEVVAIPVTNGNPDYLRWISESLRR